MIKQLSLDDIDLVKILLQLHKEVDIVFTYILMTLTFSSALLTHSLISTVFLASFLFMYLLYFLKDYRRGLDFVLLCSLLLIWTVFLLIGFGTAF